MPGGVVADTPEALHARLVGRMRRRGVSALPVRSCGQRADLR
ncbi:hypothetical protein ACNF49_31835 [Actinomadura sp. ATCC 39365]